MSVTIYTSNTCAYCTMVKKYLTNKNIDYEEINVTDQPDKQQEAFELSGSLTVPITVVNKEDVQSVFVGFNLRELAPALS